MRTWFITLLSSAAVFTISYLFARYLLKRVNLKPSYKGLLIGLLAGLAVLLLALVLKAFDIDLFQGTAKTVFNVVLALLSVGLSGYMMLARIRSGPELADLGPSPLQIGFLGFGALLILLGTRILITESAPVGEGLVSLAQGILSVVIGFARSQIRGRGIYYFGGLVPWSRIAGYEWTDRGTLLVDLRQRRWWQDRLQVPVPRIQVPQVDEMLRSHIGG